MSSGPPSSAFSGRSFKRGAAIGFIAGLLLFAYLLRGVLIPLFFAFLLAYALDPFVDRVEAKKDAPLLAAPLVMLAIAGLFAIVVIFAIPMFVDELRGRGHGLPGPDAGSSSASSPPSGSSSTSGPPRR